jgi:hypothetical protein
MYLYKVFSENETSVTYEYNSAFTWSLYLIYAIVLYGISSKSNILQLTGCIFIVIHFGIRLFLGKSVSSQIKRAHKTGGVEMSGNKHSFKDPLQFKIQKEGS